LQVRVEEDVEDDRTTEEFVDGIGGAVARAFYSPIREQQRTERKMENWVERNWWRIEGVHEYTFYP
jgi:hypothetical protein